MSDSKSNNTESNMKDKIDAINKSINSASIALDNLNNKALNGDLGFDTILKAVSDSSDAISKLGEKFGALKNISGIIPKGLKNLGGTFSSVLGGVAKLIETYDEVGKGTDSVTGYTRALNKSLYSSAAAFGGNFESAKKYSEYIISSAADFAKAEFGFISPADRIKAVKGLEQAGVPLAHMSDIVESSAGKMDLLNTSFLHSKALGLDVVKYTGMIGNAMLKQGLTTQEASEQLAMFGDISNNTGLRVDKVATSLQSLAGKYSELGLTADFGQPILEGFAESLNGMGLGFENAIELSGTLSSSLVKLTSDYGAAYITFQRGGLDMGGGEGALGASIGLRSRLLEANQTGEQGQVAMEMAGALKETLASFTGGQIVTVQEAAQDPALQATFYTQTKLLEDLYGIQDPGAQDRTLELLTQLDDATRSGNIDLAESLGKDLQDVIGSQDKTLGYQEKTAKFMEASYGEINLLNKNFIEAVRLSGSNISGYVTDISSDILDSSRTVFERLNPENPADMAVDPGSIVDFAKDIPALVNDKFSSLDSKVKNLEKMDLASILKGVILTVKDLDTEKAINRLAEAINNLVSSSTNLRESSKLSGGR